MLSNCCPAATALTTIPTEGCAQNFGQIQKIIFQRIQKSAGEKNSIADGTSTGSAGLLATWTALKVKTDGEKVVVTPFIEAPTDDGGDARTYGGGNDTLNGIEVIVGSNPVNFSCRLNGKVQSIIAAMKTLQCESLGNNLGCYLVNAEGHIEGIKEGDKWYPIPIQRLFVGDKHHGNFDGPDYNELSFSFAPGYSDKLDVLVLDASALSL